MVYNYNQDEMENLSTIQMYEKDEVLKMCRKKDETKDNTANEIKKKLDNIEIDLYEQEKVIQLLEYEYKNNKNIILIEAAKLRNY